ncbi:hypothetical protein [Tahibacter soli]|uniref:Uncharacterized protein n=1 Tax=Tahibacter soli TaxID=2983605 RepID=A0A9X4BKQ7_9GAMM|nr:hypothetical protein [Tahibacter soli]MDC8015958.1 hypothetical protein [Tahibacter soli]
MNTRTMARLLGAALALFASVAGAKTTFPAPDDAVLTSVGDNMELNGVTMSAWELRSENPPNEVLEFYRRYWAKGGPDGGKAYVENKLGNWTIITHVEGGNVYTAQVQADEAGKGAVGLLGISNLLKRADVAGKKLGEDFPKPAGSTVQNDLVAQDQGVQSRTILLQNPTSVKQNIQFYIDYFERNGWVIEEGARIVDGDVGVVIASRGSDRWQLTFSPSERSTAMVAVLEER